MTIRHDILLIALAVAIIAAALVAPARMTNETGEVAMTRHWGN